MTVKRWSVGVDGPDENGNLVAYSDYLSLAAENSSLRLTIDNIVNALGLGDGPVSQQVIELVTSLKGERDKLAVENEFIRAEHEAELGPYACVHLPHTKSAISHFKAQGVDEGVSAIFLNMNHTARGVAESLAVLRALSETLRDGGKAS